MQGRRGHEEEARGEDQEIKQVEEVKHTLVSLRKVFLDWEAR